MQIHICESTHTHISSPYHLHKECKYTWVNTFQKSHYQPIKSIKKLHRIAIALLVSKSIWTNAFDIYMWACLGLTGISSSFRVTEYAQQHLVWSVNTLIHLEYKASILKTQRNNPEENRGRCLRICRPLEAFCFLASLLPSAQVLVDAAPAHLNGSAHVQTQCSSHIVLRSTCSNAGLNQAFVTLLLLSWSCRNTALFSPHRGHVKNINISQMPSRPWSILVRTLHFLGKSCGDRNPV